MAAVLAVLEALREGKLAKTTVEIKVKDGANLKFTVEISEIKEEKVDSNAG